MVLEFVAGPECGRTRDLGHRAGPRPPLSVALPEVGGRSAVYCRRDTSPDPASGRWLFDHVPDAGQEAPP